MRTTGRQRPPSGSRADAARGAAMDETGTASVAVIAAQTPMQLVLALRDLPCTVRILPSGTSAIDAFATHPPDLVIVEEERAPFEAVALARALRATAPCARTPILLVAGGGDERALRRAAIEAGVTDLLMKPFDILDLQMRVRTLVELALARGAGDREVSAMNRRIARAVADASAREREIIRRLMLAAEFRDDQAGDHLTRVAGCVIAIAEGLGLSEAQANDIALASTMHDIGKIGVPDHILLKAGPLSDEQREEMKQHTLRGYRMLQDSPSHLLQLAAEIALTHHEHWNGMGYPRGLTGTEIPLSGRIVAVADVFDALISQRVYKPAWTHEAAKRFLVEKSGTHFDPDCVAAFLSRWDDIVVLVEERSATSDADCDAA